MESLPKISKMRNDRERALFVSACLNALFAMRDANDTAGIEFVKTLYDELDLNNEPHPKRYGKSIAERKRKRNSLKVFFGGLRRAFQTARTALNQSGNGHSLLLLGLDPTRLFWPREPNFIENVRSHIHPNLSRVHGWFEDVEQNNNWSFIGFEPKVPITQEDETSHISSEILNPFSIMLIGLFRVHFWSTSFFFSLITCLWQALENKSKSFFDRTLFLVGLLLFLMGCDVLLRKPREIRLVCMTSNSVFLELLRIMVMEQGNSQIVEILHGIPTPPFEVLLTEYGQKVATRSGSLIQIYPLLPPPICEPKKTKPGIEWREEASNTGIMKALNSLLPDLISQELVLTPGFYSTLAQRVRDNVGEIIQDGRPVFAIIGGRDHDEDYYAGKTFSVEMGLAKILRARLLEEGVDHSLVYLPHPSNSPIQGISLADGDQVTIFESSQLAFFFSDITLSLYSSGMFEASFLGAKCFSPIPDDASLFNSRYMSFITNPQNTSIPSLEEAIKTILSLDLKNELQHTEKIKTRLAKFFEKPLTVD